MHTPLPGGIYPPIPTFFDAAGELDLTTLAQHITWLIGHPLPGLLALGSNGEAMHLDDAERLAVIRAARAAINQHSRDPKAILLVGTADLSTRGTITRCRTAAEAGADVAVVLPPFAFPTQMSPAALRAHFTAVADTSPIPLIIYNMPANTANIDLSAELILELGQHPNIIGVKDSSGNVTKLALVAAHAPAGFAVLAGSGSFLIPALSVGGIGAIAAVANVEPQRMSLLYLRWMERYSAATPAQAREIEQTVQAMQALIIPLNQLVTATYGVAGLKAALQLVRKYGGVPRLPLLPLNAEQQAQIRAAFDDLRSLPN